MTQPLSGESSVLGTDLISDGFFWISTKEEAKSKEQRAGRDRSRESDRRQACASDTGFAVGGAEADGFLRKIVAGANETNGATFRAHQNRMGDGGCPLGPHATQKRAIADAGGTKDNVLSVGQIVGSINSIEFFFATLFDQIFSFFLIARPHFALHVAAETFDYRRRQHRYGRAADSHVKIDAAVGNGGRHCRRDVAVPDH